jgi:serine/threonine protein kinase
MAENEAGSSACRKVARHASRIAEKVAAKSHVVDRRKESTLAKFDKEEVVLGKLLGSGNFANVYDLENIELLPEPENPADKRTEKQQNKREDVWEKGKTGKYCVKMLSPEAMSDPETFQIAAANICVEAMYLSNLKHPHIVRIRAMCAQGASGFSAGEVGAYFLIMDKVECTLALRIEEWSEIELPVRRRILQYNDTESDYYRSTTKFLSSLLRERLQFAIDLAGALAYLHDQMIVHRDLQPENIGFDFKGKLKLFDFGSARELDPDNPKGIDPEILSINKCPRPYVAPEVALEEPAHLSADVYSFGVLLWELCALKLPFEEMSDEQYVESVVLGHERPEIFPEWSMELAQLMMWCWKRNANVRPQIEDIPRALLAEMERTTMDEDAPKISSRDTRANLAHSTSRRRGSLVGSMGTSSRVSEAPKLTMEERAKADAPRRRMQRRSSM